MADKTSKKPRLLKPTEEQIKKIKKAFENAQEFDKKHGLSFKQKNK
jgi:hypothetical protein